MSFRAADSKRRIVLGGRPGVVDDRHDPRQLGNRLYARLLLLGIVVLPRGSPGLAVRSNDLDLGSFQNDADVLLVASEVRAALDIVRLDLYAEFGDAGEDLDAADVAHASTRVPTSTPRRREVAP